KSSWAQLQLPEFRFIPQWGHKPLQSTVQSVFIGRANKICSRRISVIANRFPVKNAVRVSLSFNSISSSSSNIASSRSLKKSSKGLLMAMRDGSRHREHGSSRLVFNDPAILI